MTVIQDDHVELRKACAHFRRAIEQSNAKTFCIWLEHFPNGACGFASELLAKYLKDQGYGQFDYVLGQRRGESHAWLQQDTLIIDITADQFQDQHHSIIITYNSHFHAQFNGEVLYPAGLFDLDSTTKQQLDNAYSAIINYCRKLNV